MPLSSAGARATLLRVTTRVDDQQARLGPSFDLVESKLRAPLARPGIVPRRALVERLLASSTAPLICVVAPPGYGKTTLLAQWASRRSAVAWVSLDRRDNDPVVLLSYLAAALDRVEPIDPGVFQALASPGASVAATVMPRLVSAIAATTRPVALALDHLELLENRGCLDAVAELALRLPGCAPRAGRRRSGPLSWPWTSGRRAPCWTPPGPACPTPR